MQTSTRLLSQIGKTIVGTVLTIQSIPVQSQALEEIVVTAQRREQTLQEVPISIDVTTGRELEDQGFRDLNMMGSFVPSLRIDSARTGNQETTQMRGIGTSGTVLALETAVPIFSDGVIFGRRSQLNSAFLDIERVEVLRGPQPVFFGQNATAGAISIITRKPTAEWEGFALGEVGNNGINTIEFGVGGPVTDTFGVRVAGKYDESDGFMKDFITGDKYPARDATVARLSLRWQPNNSLQISSRFEMQNVESELRAEQAVAVQGFPGLGVALLADPGLFVLNGIQPALPFDDDINDVGTRKFPVLPTPDALVETFGTGRNVTPGGVLGGVVDLSNLYRTRDPLNRFDVNNATHGEFSDLETWNAYVDLEYTFANDVVLSTKVAYVDNSREYMQEFSTAQPWMTAPLARFDQLDQWSQELRLTSPTGGNIEWMLGLYGQQNDRQQGALFIHAAFESRVLPGPRRTRAWQDSRWLSAFGTMTFNFLDDRASVDVGGRWTNVKNEARHTEYTADFIMVGGGPPVDNGVVESIGEFTRDEFAPGVKDNYGKNDTNEFNPQITLRYRATDNVSFYVKWAEAFKAGSFDTSVVSVVNQRDFEFLPEFAENFEVGAKGKFFDGRLGANVTLFTETVSDLQVSSFDEAEGRSRIANVGEQRVRGVEFDGEFLATDRLRLGFAGALLDGELISYPNARCTLEERQLGVCGANGLIDRSGEDAPFTPDWDFNLNMTYTQPVLDRYELSFNANFEYSDGFITSSSFERQIQQDKFEDLNLRVAFGRQDNKWEVAIWGRNLTEPKPSYFSEFDFNSNAEAVDLSANNFMTYGVQARYSF